MTVPDNTNDVYLDTEKLKATKWQWFCARLFGNWFTFKTNEGCVYGYRYRGATFITKVEVTDEREQP